jgi:hypothetical protein
MGDNILEADDPRGAHIVLSRENWEKHILREHPEMLDRIDEIRQALTDPFVGIFQDQLIEDCYSYYARNLGSYIKLSVEMRSERYGLVRTAYPVNNLKEGELLWWTYSNKS